MSEDTEVKKTVIRPKTEGMVKTKGGSFHTNDFIGNTLSGLTVEQVLEIGKEAGVAVEKYAHLNKGQQRMNVGNALRKVAKDETKQAAITEQADAFKEANAAAAEAAAKAKADAKAAKAETAEA
jgi:hypothetical protein